MGRPAKYGSDEERRAADAERKRKARMLVDPSLPVKQLDEAGPAAPVQRGASVSLERYVEENVAAALRFSERIGESDEPFEIALNTFVTNRRRDRLERAERYARWRYAGFLSGEVASL
jgi:hypothetical protein